MRITTGGLRLDQISMRCGSLVQNSGSNTLCRSNSHSRSPQRRPPHGMPRPPWGCADLLEYTSVNCEQAHKPNEEVEIFGWDVKGYVISRPRVKGHPQIPGVAHMTILWESHSSTCLPVTRPESQICGIRWLLPQLNGSARNGQAKDINHNKCDVSHRCIVSSFWAHTVDRNGQILAENSAPPTDAKS